MVKKTENNPTQPAVVYKYLQSPRCGAKTRQQTPCLAPAINGKKRCRMHGGKGSGAPLGSQNALKHGRTTREAKAEKLKIRCLLKRSREFMKKCGFGH